jgi:DNA-binding transcriptional LysR family regulator
MNSTLIAALSILGTMVLTSLYGLATTAIRKRVRIRSPEAQAIEQMVPAVNALLEAQPSQMTALVAILEAQKGICNGNVDAALVETREAANRFNHFLMSQARIG